MNNTYPKLQHKVILLHKNGETEEQFMTLNEELMSNLKGTTASERWNENLQAFLFTPRDYIIEMLLADKNRLF